ncbi:hypothetical protein KIPB_007636, partial [Kipferlia bialata]
GRPVMFMKMDKLPKDMKEIAVDCLVAMIYCFELMNQYPPHVPCVFFMDMKGIKMSNIDMRFEKSSGELVMDFYDYRSSGPMPITHMPWWMRMFMKACAGWIPDGLMDKLLVVKDLKSLETNLPLDRIPKEFGGLSDFDQEAFNRWREEVEGVDRNAPPTHTVDMRLLRAWNLSFNEPAGTIEAVKKGTGYKKTRSNRWKKYYFVLDEGILFYYKNKKARTSNNGIMMEETLVHSGEEAQSRSIRAKIPAKKRLDKNGDSKIVVLEVIDREYFFDFVTAQEAQEWAAVMTQSGEDERTKRGTAIEGDFGSAAGMQADIGECRDMADLEEEEEDHDAVE